MLPCPSPLSVVYTLCRLGLTIRFIQLGTDRHHEPADSLQLTVIGTSSSQHVPVRSTPILQKLINITTV